MSLYNLLFGMNGSLAAVASTVLGFRIDQVFPRFRDIFTAAEDAPWPADVFVYTRMGGGNRDCWCEDTEKPCSACRADELEAEPWCVGSYDDDFDSTFRTFGVRFTEGQRAEFEAALAGNATEEFKARLTAMFPPKIEDKP